MLGDSCFPKAIVTHYRTKAMDAIKTDFQEIYAAFYPKILRYMTRMVGDNEAGNRRCLSGKSQSY
jgi:hypothetical protein